jgi:hypothetical protein
VGFQADDARAGNDAVILLGDAIWRSRFNADPQVIGKDIRFTDRVYRVIGVMPPSFAFPDASIEAWRPFVMSDAERELNRQGNVGMIDVGGAHGAGRRAGTGAGGARCHPRA